MSDMHGGAPNNDHHVSDHVSSHAPAAGKTRDPLKSMAAGAGLSILALLVVVSIVLTIGVYKLGWNNPATDVLTHALPLPAASVNGDKIAFSQFQDDVNTVHRYFAKIKEKNGGVAQQPEPTEEQIRAGVMDRLIQMEILKQQAAKYDIKVTDEEVDAEFEKFQQSGQSEDPAGEIQDLYGWSLTQFKDKVMRPYLLQEKLTAALGEDESLNADAKKQAEDILARVKDGADFAEEARQHSADPGSASEGGELGWFEPGVMVTEFEEAAFALEPNEISDLVRTQFGFHIIKTEEVEKDKDGAVTKVRAAHILIPLPSLDSFLQQKTEEAEIKKYVSVKSAEEVMAESGLAE